MPSLEKIHVLYIHLMCYAHLLGTFISVDDRLDSQLFTYTCRHNYYSGLYCTMLYACVGGIARVHTKWFSV